MYRCSFSSARDSVISARFSSLCSTSSSSSSLQLLSFVRLDISRVLSFFMPSQVQLSMKLETSHYPSAGQWQLSSLVVFLTSVNVCLQSVKAKQSDGPVAASFLARLFNPCPTHCVECVA